MKLLSQHSYHIGSVHNCLSVVNAYTDRKLIINACSMENTLHKKNTQLDFILN